MATESTKEERVARLNQIQSSRKQQALEKVEQTLKQMQKMGKKINFATVAHEANVSQSYLYKYPEIKSRIAEIRNQQSSMPRPRSKEPTSANSHQAIVSKLKDRIKKLEAEVTGLRNINEGLAGRVYRVSELEALVERQQKYINDLETRLKACEERYRATILTSPPVNDPKITPIDKSKRRKPEIPESVKVQMAELGISLNTTLTKTILSATEELVLSAIQALKEALEHGNVDNPGGWLNKAIKDGWIPNEKYVKKGEWETFNEWFSLARKQGLVMASMKGDDDKLYIFTKDGVRLPFEKMLCQHPLEELKSSL